MVIFFLASRSAELAGIFRSSNNGIGWEKVLMYDKLSTTVFANNEGLVITGSTTLSVFDTNKIFLSTDYGSTWSSTVQPTKWGISVTDIKQDPMNNLFFGTSAAGLYEVDIITNVEEESLSDFNYYLSQNYPNPFNPVTTISYQIKELGLAQLKVFDMLGRKVATLLNEIKPAGHYSIEYNAAALPSWIYFYELTSGQFTSVKKMILIK